MDQPKTNAETFDLQRFIDAQDRVYSQVLAELRTGRKQTHWMWFVFPQIVGLGHSATSRRYAIRSGAEARAYLAHPILGARLRECVRILLKGQTESPEAIFGQPDTMKFRSSLTLFAAQVGDDSIFAEALEKFFDGQWDEATLKILNSNG